MFQELKRLLAKDRCESLRQSGSEIYERVRTFGLPAERIEDDIFQVHEQVGLAVQAIKIKNQGRFSLCA